MDVHETFMQQIIALGVAANYIARSSPDRYKHCKDTAHRAEVFINKFREFPRWKKEKFNLLFEQKEEKIL